MIVIPAVDVMDHEVVQLVGGKPGSQQVVLPDILETAKGWVAKGAPYLHLVDLDAAFGKPDNSDAFCRVIKEVSVPCEVGGGIRSETQIAKYIDAGADRVIVGTKAIKEPEWFAEMARKFPGKLVLGMDTKGGRISIKGWQEEVDLSIDKVFDDLRKLPVRGVLNTNIDVEGQGKGVNAAANAEFVRKCPCPVILSGGFTTLEDAKAGAATGAEAAVVGMAVYKGNMRPWEWETPWKA
ncbi:MAG: HisA/HisF-related TIM barrel protein [Methanomethylophilus sp.]|jgi:phosphoribosylformimino-5-aminoimidazole carboxamide ribotide isomerase